MFLLNFFWESWHGAFLYEGYYGVGPGDLNSLRGFGSPHIVCFVGGYGFVVGCCVGGIVSVARSMVGKHEWI